MVDISEELNTIKTAVYGKDMRQAIYDALDKLSKSSSSAGTVNSTVYAVSAGKPIFGDANFVEVSVWQ